MLIASETGEHLDNLDHIGSRDLRRAYLAVMLAAERAGFRTEPRLKGSLRELQIRDRSRRQPFALAVERSSLLFYLRRPALDVEPGLGGEARARFADRVVGDASLDEVRIRIRDERDADDVVAWLFEDSHLSPGYAERRSA